MNWLKKKRIKQVLQYGWKDAKEIGSLANKGRIAVWLDIIKCFKKFYVFSNQYKAKEAWKLNDGEREQLLRPLGEKNRYRDDWTVWKYENAVFLDKYGSKKYGSTPKRYSKRLKEYMKRDNLGEGTKVSNNVVIERNHYLEGSLKVGRNVLLSKNVYIDYSGEVVIGDNVKIANGVIIESHHRDLEANNQGKDVNIPTKLTIGESAYIGTRAIILDSCNYIGRNVRIGAGAVVVKDIPDNAVAVGVPAKVVKMLE